MAMTYVERKERRVLLESSRASDEDYDLDDGVGSGIRCPARTSSMAASRGTLGRSSP